MQTAGAVGGLAHSTAWILKTNQNVDKAISSKKGDISDYKGPSVREFPFRSIRLLGSAQLIVALLIQIITIIQISLGYGDRFVFLANASVNVWTPLPAIAAGIVAISMSERRYWETQCMKVAYFVLSIMSAAVFMVILLFVTGIVESHYYDIASGSSESNRLVVPPDVEKELKDDDTRDRTGTHKALIGSILALALLELIISFVSVFIVCYCAPTYRLKDKAMRKKLHGAHDPVVRRGSIGSDSDVQQVIMRDRHGQPVACAIEPCPPMVDSMYGNRHSNTYVTSVPNNMYVTNGSNNMYATNITSTKTPSIFVVD